MKERQRATIPKRELAVHQGRGKRNTVSPYEPRKGHRQSKKLKKHPVFYFDLVSAL